MDNVKKNAINPMKTLNDDIVMRNTILKKLRKPQFAKRHKRRALTIVVT
jgi:NADH dehydrogenase